MTGTKQSFSFSDIDLWIFDLDGTVVDSSVDIANAVNIALGGVGVPTWPLEAVKKMIGNGTKTLVELALKGHEKRFDEAFRHFSDHYSAHLLDQTKPFPGVVDFLTALNGKKRALLSNKRQEYCDPIIDGLGLRRYFDLVLGGDALPQKKPSPEPIFFICEKLNVSPRRTVMVGDSPIDVQTGLRAGTRTIALLDGFCSPEEIRASSADLIVDRVASLTKLLEQTGNR